MVDQKVACSLSNHLIKNILMIDWLIISGSASQNSVYLVERHATFLESPTLGYLAGIFSILLSGSPLKTVEIVHDYLFYS